MSWTDTYFRPHPLIFSWKPDRTSWPMIRRIAIRTCGDRVGYLHLTILWLEMPGNCWCSWLRGISGATWLLPTLPIAACCTVEHHSAALSHECLSWALHRHLHSILTLVITALVWKPILIFPPLVSLRYTVKHRGRAQNESCFLCLRGSI